MRGRKGSDETEKSDCKNGCFQGSYNGGTGTSISQKFPSTGKALLRLTSTCTAGDVHRWTYIVTLINTTACTVSWITQGAEVHRSAPQKVTVMTDPLKLYTRNPEGKSHYSLSPSETFHYANSPLLVVKKHPFY